MTPDFFKNLYHKDYKKTYYYESNKKYFYNELSYLTQMCLADSKVFLPEHNLLYSDKATMMAGVESRPPLVDHRIIEFMFSLTPDFRIRRNNQKYLLKKVSEKYLTKQLISRPKAPFGSPIRSWVRNELRELVNDLLLGDNLNRKVYYNMSFVRKIINDNNNGIADNSAIIWQLLTTELWLKQFFN